MHRGAVALARCHQRMTHLVVRYDTLLVHGHTGIFSLVTGNNDLNTLFKVSLCYKGTALAYRTQCALVDDVSEFCTAGTGGCTSDRIKINITSQLDILCMNLQNCYTPLQIRKLNRDPAVKTARTKKCLIQGLRTVGRCQDHNTLAAIETIHLG